MSALRSTNLAVTMLRGALAGFGVTLLIVLSGLGATGLPWRDVPLLGSIVVVGFMFVVLVFLLSGSVLRLRTRTPSVSSLVLLGVASALVTTVALAYVFEGLEEGVVSLFADPAFWIWLVGFALGGATLGCVWQASRQSAAL